MKMIFLRYNGTRFIVKDDFLLLCSLSNFITFAADFYGDNALLLIVC